MYKINRTAPIQTQVNDLAERFSLTSTEAFTILKVASLIDLVYLNLPRATVLMTWYERAYTDNPMSLSQLQKIINTLEV